MARYEGRHRNASADAPTQAISRITDPRTAPGSESGSASRSAPASVSRAASTVTQAMPQTPAPTLVPAIPKREAAARVAGAHSAPAPAPVQSRVTSTDGPRIESRVQSRTDSRMQPRTDSRMQPRADSRAQARGAATSPSRTVARTSSRTVAAEPARAAGAAAATPPATRRARRETTPKRRVGRPLLASGLAVGLGVSVLGYAAAVNLDSDDAAYVVGDGVVAQTDELARASTVDMTYRAAASVSRNERRTAIAATGLRNAQELEAKKKAEAARKAREAKEAKEREEREKAREEAIANARENPQAAARVLMLDYGWTSDAQYNCLVNLWNGESGWRYTAENPSSGAYGIPQSLPASKMAKFGDDYRTNPITQIKWGLWYIDAVYGNPCNAWSTWQARSPHWY